ncbi:MAG: aromatic ring-hydroxylating dioxygenase subunit alpha [Candidatus Eremiobacteraeota bacterium]|nr:aromatic ring-hydroxylating dioxygenase subunit alpha [Candidatus Eremiobacteraeota bacterium]
MTTFSRAQASPAARTLEARCYCDPDVYALESERVFARSWTVAGRSDELEGAGAFKTVEVVGESVIVVRGDDGALRAFFNVCRHRGTRICTEIAGRFGGSIQCPYHAWTYGLDGTLVAARYMDDTPDFDAREYPLRAIRVAEWEGFVFINLSPKAFAFEDTFEALTGRFTRWHLPSLRIARSFEYDVAANWKLLFQNYSECYHCAVIHPQLEKLSPWDSGRNDLSEGPALGGYSALRDGAARIANGTSHAFAPLGDVDGDDLRRAYYYTIFPTLLLSLQAEYVMVHIIRPVAVDRTRVTCQLLFAPTEMARADFDPSSVAAFWDTTNRQDWHVSELSQLGIASRAYRPGPYARSEGLLDAFDRHYLTTMSAG